LDSFAEAIRPELQSIPTPEPSPELLDRIIASRAAGARVILPEVPAESRRVFATYASVAAVIAAAVVVVVYGVSTSRSEDVVSVSGLFGREAYAQPVVNADRPALPFAVFAPGSAIRPMKLEFRRRVHDSVKQLTTETTDTLTVTASNIEGTAAWKLATLTHIIGTQQPSVEAETVYVARTNLKLLRRSVHVSPYSRFERINIQQSFRGDSVTGRMNTDGPSIGAGRAIARRLRPEFGPYISDAMAPLALMGTPLSATWKRSASLIGWAVIPKDIFYPIELRVDGADRVTVPAGTFDCWRISIRLPDKQITYWARKSDGLGVRVLDESNTTTKGTREVVLRRVVE
jgi:hypothetical protein